jgi:AAT family amino acid transporter/GABA permease
MWLFPYLTWATIAVITFVLGYMLTDDSKGGGRIQVLLSVLLAAVVVAISVLRERNRKNARIETADRQ